MTSENEPTQGGAPETPAESEMAAEGVEDVPEEVVAERRAELESLIDLLRPAVQVDGGDLELVEADYVNGVVEVELQGACGSCAISGATLTEGVERILKERLSWVTEVVGGVNEEIDAYESAAMGRGAYVPKYY